MASLAPSSHWVFILTLNSQFEEGARDGIDNWYIGIITYIGQVAHQNMIRTKRINWYINPITDPRTKTSWPWWLISFWFLKYLSAEGSKDIWNQVPWIFINSAIFQNVMTVQWWKYSWCHQFSGPRHQMNKMIQNFFTWFKRSFRTLFYILLWSRDF